MSCLRKLLVQSEFTSSKAANCEDELNILNVPSTSQKSTTATNNEIANDEILDKKRKAIDQIEKISANDNLLDSSLEASISYNAGLIEQKVQTAARFNCKECEKVFTENDKLSDSCIRSAKMNLPCVSTVLICKIADKYMRTIRTFIINFDYKLIFQRIYDDVDMANVYEKSFMNCEMGHKDHFVRFVIEDYMRVTANDMAREITVEQHRVLHRKYLKKIIHHTGQ